MGRDLVALLHCGLEPAKRLRDVALDAETASVDDPEVALCIPEARLGGLLEPEARLLGVPGWTEVALVEQAEPVLRLAVSSLGCRLVPASC